MITFGQMGCQTHAILPPALRARRILVIGYGNPGRQDDGLGPVAAAAIGKIGWCNVTVMDNYQLTIEDAIELAARDLVWFIDASVSGGEPYEVRHLSPTFGTTFTSHLLEPETLLAITEQQFGVCPEAYLLSIRGYTFDFYEGITERAQNNLAKAVALLRRRIGRLSLAPQ